MWPSWNEVFVNLLVEIIGSILVASLVWLIFRRSQEQQQARFRSQLVRNVRADATAGFLMFLNDLVKSCSLKKLADSGNRLAKVLLKVQTPPGFGRKLESDAIAHLAVEVKLSLSNTEQVMSLIQSGVVNTDVFFKRAGENLSKLRMTLREEALVGAAYLPGDLLTSVNELSQAIAASTFSDLTEYNIIMQTVYTHQILLRLTDLLGLVYEGLEEKKTSYLVRDIVLQEK